MTLPSRSEALACLTAFVTLASQVLVHRMVQAKLLNNFAFLVISLTMLGFAASGVVLTRFRRRLFESREDTLFASVALFAVTLVLASLIFYHAPSGEGWATSRKGFVLAFLYSVPFALIYSIPFGFCGLILGILLSSPDLSTRRVYFFDLLGSALGAVAVVPAIGWFGVEVSAFSLCALFIVGGVMCLGPKGWMPRLVGGLGIIASTVSVVYHGRLFTAANPRHSFLGMTQVEGSGYALERVVWDPVARIEVLKTPPPDPDSFAWPSLIGGNREFHLRFTRMLTQNNNAFTYAVAYDGNLSSIKGVEETIYSAAYQATGVHGPEVLVIGVGGGFDVLNALYFGARRVTGVEVNAATIRIVTSLYRDYFRPWVEDPRVTLVHGEGRHFLSRDRGKYDVIQLSGVDSVSGTPAAAHVFSENYLYTSEAFDTYLSHLTDQGILNMMRGEFVPPREMLRALISAVEALRRMGVARPAEHITVLMAPNGGFTAMLLKKKPFSPEEIDRLVHWTSGSRWFLLAAAPGMTLPDNMYQRFLFLADSRKERAFSVLYPFDVRPTDDDRPFFFHFSYWSHLFSKDPVVRTSIPAMQYGLAILLVITAAAAILCVYLPLRDLAKEGLEFGHKGRHAVFFGGIGVGYLAIEVALLQKCGLFLGHPNYALSVVLAVLLFSSGIGSLLSASIVRRIGELRYVSYVVCVLVLGQHVFVLPRLSSWVHLGFTVRILIVCATVAPLGIALGTLFPSALERVKTKSAGAVPWAWGLNGIFSVVAPILGVAMSMTFGIAALLLSAVPIYLLVGLATPRSAP